MQTATRRALLALVVLATTTLTACTGTPGEVRTYRAYMCPMRTATPAPTDAPGGAWAIDAIDLPPRADASGAGVTVAVVDSGLAPGAIPDAAVAPESRSFVDGEDLADDDSGHGTAMAGLVNRVAPDARVLALKAVDDSGQARMDWIANAVRFATDSGADVISLSLETTATDDGLEDALKRASDAGATIVIAAGNEQLDLDGSPRYPASYDIAGSLVVAASDRDGALAASTNRGAGTVDLAAPGDAVTVVQPGDATAEISGSSPAAALTAGAVAILLSADPAPADPASLLTASVTPRPDLQGQVASGGTLDVGAALACGALAG